MPHSSDLRTNLNGGVTLLLSVAGFFFGGFTGWAILVGDELGRVNILYLLLVYLFLPIASVVISTISLLFGSGFNFAQLLKRLPLWSPEQQQFWRQLRQQGFDRLWFFQASQLVAICFSLAGLVVFFLLLLATDINFVWRSTLLTAQDLLPLLQWLSAPWRYWEAAQPGVELLLQTQDSRIAPGNASISSYAQWWQFVLAIQIFYSFLPRGLLLVAARIMILRKMSRAERQDPVSRQSRDYQGEGQEILAPVVTRIENTCTLVNWGGIPDLIVEQLAKHYPQQISGELHAGPTAEDAQHSQAQQAVGSQLVLVKSWEPPLAELADYLHDTHGYLLPVDWKNSAQEAVTDFHLEEWRRFTATQDNWQLLAWRTGGMK
ncbi:MAG: DUF2868 domain-containing protein [bacterium]|nr:DUF2868 domain-containing protein [Gammaproteobacteria bacterium]